MQRIETDSKILHVVVIRQTVSKEGERASQTSQRVLWQFSQKSFIMSQIPHPTEGVVLPTPVYFI